MFKNVSLYCGQWKSLSMSMTECLKGEVEPIKKENLLKDIYNLFSLGEKSVDALPKNMI